MSQHNPHTNLPLFMGPPPRPAPGSSAHFDGSTYKPDFDYSRLTGRQAALWVFMVLESAGAWRSLAEISDATGYPEASVSAGLRDFRKPKWGRHMVEAKRVPCHERAGWWVYRIIPGDPENPPALKPFERNEQR